MHAAPPPRCHTSELRATLGQGGVGLGNVEVPVYLRNRSTHACVLFGYAGFGLLDTHGRPLPSHVRRGSTYFAPDPRPHRVVLRPRQSAETQIAFGDNPGPGEPLRGPCEPQSGWLLVTPPDETTSLRVPFHDTVCGHGSLDTPALEARRP